MKVSGIFLMILLYNAAMLGISGRLLENTADDQEKGYFHTDIVYLQYFLLAE